MVAAAMLDRLLHRSVVFNIDGDSYRMRAHRARSEQLRKGVTPTTDEVVSATTHPGDQLGNFSDREWGVSEIGGIARAGAEVDADGGEIAGAAIGCAGGAVVDTVGRALGSIKK